MALERGAFAGRPRFTRVFSRSSGVTIEDEAGAAASAAEKKPYRFQVAEKEKIDEFAEFVSRNIVKAVGKCLHRSQIEERYATVNDGNKLPDEATFFRDYMASKGFVYDSTKRKTVNQQKKKGCYTNCALT